MINLIVTETSVHNQVIITVTGQGWISYTGTYVSMFVPKLGLIKPGQTYVCPQPWAFCMKILLWLILYFWETSSQLCS